MELVDIHTEGDRVNVTLADDVGLTRLVGTSDEIVALSGAMEQAAVLAGVADQPAWLAELRVGDDVVRLGVGNGRVRLLTGPAR
jgi:hypothetical protein